MKLYNLLLIAILPIACSKKQKTATKATFNVIYDKAFEYRQAEKLDSAFKYFDKAKDVFLLQNDSLGVAKCFSNMGLISTVKGDYFGAQDLSLKALDYFNKKIDTQFVHIKSNYNNLGRATYQLKDYQNSLKFYNSAIKFSRNPSDTQTYLNNKAKTYQEIKEYDKALKTYDLALKGISVGSKEYARILTNISLTKWLSNPSYNAVPTYLIALNIRKKENDLWGQNSSYAHLADYYSYKNVDSTLIYANKMYQVAKRIVSPDDQLQALKTLIRFSPSKETKQYFDIYQKLSDSIQIAQNASKNQFAIIRYDIGKKEAENLKLQKDNTEKKYQIARREAIIFISLIAIISLIVIFMTWYKKRKQKLELLAAKNLRESQLKTSKKVHDVVANKIYSVISEIENRKELDKENLLDKLDHIYHASRDISYEITENQQDRKFSQQLSDMFYTYLADPSYVKITGNEDGIWSTVSNHNKGEIFIVLQELMTNMNKHSKATEVNIKFDKKDKVISIHYHDNGIGLPKNVIKNNGLRNTETRIKNISGTLTFETINKSGLEILISFPVN